MSRPPLRVVLHSRRSKILLIVGTLYVAIGVSYLGSAARNEILESSSGLKLHRGALTLMPLQIWGLLFLLAGLTAICAGLTTYRTIGYSALMAMSSWWGLEFVVSFMSTGYVRCVVNAFVWALTTSCLWVIAGWPDPPNGLPLSWRD